MLKDVWLGAILSFEFGILGFCISLDHNHYIYRNKLLVLSHTIIDMYTFT